MLRKTCTKCKQVIGISCTFQQYDRWIKGKEPIQRVMPDVPKDERELLISGICGKCFDSLFETESEGTKC